MPKKLDRQTVLKLAQELQLSFKELKGFKKAKIADIQPVYEPDGKTTAFHEIAYALQGGGQGYAMISATDKDLPVVEFSHAAKSHYRRFKAKLGDVEFRMIRFGPAYITAESPRGKLLAEIGQRPDILVKPPRIRGRVESGDSCKITRATISRKLTIVNLKKHFKADTYAALKKHFQPIRPTAKLVKKRWEKALSPHSPDIYRYYWADGYNNHSFFLQIPPHTRANHEDHWSGCGPTAMMNLFGWHDLNWTATLLQGTRKYNNNYIDELTMELHDYLGTSNLFGGGFTWPENMGNGFSFAKEQLEHDLSYWLRFDYGLSTDEAWVFEVARDMARKKRPFIVLYNDGFLGLPKHYAIGCGIAEDKSGWRDNSWIWMYPALTDNDSENKWVNMGSILGIWGAYRFWKNPVGSLGALIKSYVWTGGWTTTEFYEAGGKQYLFLLKYKGTGSDKCNVHIHLMNDNGTVGTKIDKLKWSEGWTQAKPFRVGNNQYLFLLKKGTGDVHIHKINNTGKVGTKIADCKWTKNWTTVEFYTVGGKTFLLLLKENDKGKDGYNVHIHEMNTNGTVGAKIDRCKWTKGWTQAKPFVSGGNQYLFLLKKGTGKVHIHRLAGNGKVGSLVKKYDWTKGWSSVEFYTVGNTTFLYLAKATGVGSDGSNIHIHRMNANGTVGTKIFTTKWPLGPTPVKPFASGNKQFMFNVILLPGIVNKTIVRINRIVI